MGNFYIHPVKNFFVRIEVRRFKNIGRGVINRNAIPNEELHIDTIERSNWVFDAFVAAIPEDGNEYEVILCEWERDRQRWYERRKVVMQHDTDKGEVAKIDG